MPAKAKIVRRKKRVVKRKPAAPKVRIGGGAAVSVRVQDTGFPSTMFRKLVYNSAAITLTSTTAEVFYQFNLNSIFDPNRTGAGHQPMGRDQFALLYNTYRVDRADYEITIVNDNTLLPFNYRWGINPSTSGPVAGTSDETKRWSSGTGGANHSAVSIKGSVNLWDAASVSKQRYQSDDLFSRVMTASPAITPTLQLYMQGFDETTSTAFCFTFKVIYHTKFWEPIYLSGS